MRLDGSFGSHSRRRAGAGAGRAFGHASPVSPKSAGQVARRHGMTCPGAQPACIDAAAAVFSAAPRPGSPSPTSATRRRRRASRCERGVVGVRPPCEA